MKPTFLTGAPFFYTFPPDFHFFVIWKLHLVQTHRVPSFLSTATLYLYLGREVLSVWYIINTLIMGAGTMFAVPGCFPYFLKPALDLLFG